MVLYVWKWRVSGKASMWKNFDQDRRWLRTPPGGKRAMAGQAVRGCVEWEVFHNLLPVSHRTH